MKPIGPIPQGFQSLDGELAIGGVRACELVERAGGTPLFVYSAEMVRNRIAEVRAALPDRLAIHYAVKANPFGPLLELLKEEVDGFDIASGGELAAVTSAGIEPGRVSFAGPGKRDSELLAAISAGVTINLESENEARRALAIGERTGITPHLAIRVNPDFELKGSGMKMGGGAKPFGIDVERVPDLARNIISSGAVWQGLHIFAGSQALDSAAIVEAQSGAIELAARIASDLGSQLPRVNIGGGFGIPYFYGDEPLDLEPIGINLVNEFKNLSEYLENTNFCVELGRYIVGEAGVYLTQVVDRKTSHGETFLVTDGGLHHQLAASGNFGTVVRRNYPVASANHFGAEADDPVSIVGCLCTPLDRLADRIMFPRTDVGDLIAVFCAGAYGATASPANFLGQGPAREMLV